MEVNEMKATTTELLDEQIRKTLMELDDMKVFSDESDKHALQKLTTLCSQQKELKKIEVEQQKIDADTAIRIRELELKEENDKKNRALEEEKLRQQKRANTTNAVIGGVTAATGVAGILATLHCFKKSMIFEETGSYTNKSGQMVGSMFNLFRRR